MPESTSTLVECPVCEEEFDPTAAGGWCTNSECGEWRHEAADLPTGGTNETAGEAAEKSPEASVSEESIGDGDESAADPTPAIQRVSDASDEADDQAPGEDDTAGAVPAEDEADAASTVTDGEVDSGQAIEADAADEEPAAGEGTDAEITCPGCGETLAAEVNFCPSCGEDVSAVNPGEDEPDDELTSCPACDAEVGPDASFCPSCGEGLDAHRESDVLTACPSCGDDVDPGDGFCASCGADLAEHREDGATESPTDAAAVDDEAQADAGEDAPDSLVLETRGNELTVGDGDTVGRELRRIVTDSGGDESEAVRIHREHVRFVRDDGHFHVVDLGRNPTHLNDESLQQGDREPVGPGDDLTLSNVITLAISDP
jgi:hypothetical protein